MYRKSSRSPFKSEFQFLGPLKRMPHHSMIKHRGQGTHEARTRQARRYKWVTFGSRPFDFLGVAGGGGGGGFKKRISCPENCFPGRKFLQGNTWRKKPTLKTIFHGVQCWKKKSYTVLVRKKFYHQRFGKKKRILTQTKSPILPPPPSKLSEIVGSL